MRARPWPLDLPSSLERAWWSAAAGPGGQAQACAWSRPGSGATHMPARPAQPPCSAAARACPDTCCPCPHCHSGRHHRRHGAPGEPHHQEGGAGQAGMRRPHRAACTAAGDQARASLPGLALARLPRCARALPVGRGAGLGLPPCRDALPRSAAPARWQRLQTRALLVRAGQWSLLHSHFLAASMLCSSFLCLASTSVCSCCCCCPPTAFSLQARRLAAL